MPWLLYLLDFIMKLPLTKKIFMNVFCACDGNAYTVKHDQRDKRIITVVWKIIIKRIFQNEFNTA